MSRKGLLDGMGMDEDILDEIWFVATRPPISAKRGAEDDNKMVGKVALAVSSLASDTPVEAAARDYRSRWLSILEAARHLKELIPEDSEALAADVAEIEQYLERTVACFPDPQRRKPGPDLDEALVRATRSVCCTLGSCILKRGGQTAVRDILNVGWSRRTEAILSETTFRDHYWPHGKLAVSYAERASRALHEATTSPDTVFEMDGITAVNANCNFDSFERAYRRGCEALVMEISLVRDAVLAGENDLAIKKIDAMLDCTRQ